MQHHKKLGCPISRLHLTHLFTLSKRNSILSKPRVTQCISNAPLMSEQRSILTIFTTYSFCPKLLYSACCTLNIYIHSLYINIRLKSISNSALLINDKMIAYCMDILGLCHTLLELNEPTLIKVKNFGTISLNGVSAIILSSKLQKLP